MPDATDYAELYDRLRRAGYHQDDRDQTHLDLHLPWIREHLEYDSVLDIGSSTGGALPLLTPDGQRACGVDVSQLAVERGRELGRDIRLGSATELPFPDRSFDLVVSADVFEHLHPEDAPQAVREALRVARRYLFMKIASQPDVTRQWQEVAGHRLHLTTQPLEWWTRQFAAGGGRFIFSADHTFCLELEPAKRD